MKEQDYISTGELELYVLDVLSQEERKDAYGHLVDPDVESELFQIEETVRLLAEKGQVAPRLDLKNQIFSAIEEKENPTVSKSSSGKYLMAATVSIAILSSLMSFVFWNQWKTTETKLQIAMSESAYLANQAEFTIRKLDDLQNDLKVYSDPSFQQIVLNGTESAPDHMTFVYWNAQTKETYLQISQLAELSEDKQYQLWSIQEGQPVDAGVFDLSAATALIKMKSNEAPQAFAITIEPKGGSVSPTLSTMVVVGNVPA